MKIRFFVWISLIDLVTRCNLFHKLILLFNETYGRPYDMIFFMWHNKLSVVCKNFICDNISIQILS